MRILSVHVGFGPRGGGAAERYYAMAVHLLRAGEDVRLLLTDKWFVDGHVPAEYPFPAERMTVLPLLNDRYDVPLLSTRRIDEAVRDADVIHLMGHLSPLSATVCSSARRLRKPWFVCVAGMLPFRGRSLRLKNIAQWLWGADVLREAAGVIAITVDEQKLLAPYASQPERVSLVPNAIELAPPNAPLPPFDSSPYLLFLGGFHPTKGAGLLVEAFARVAHSTLRDHRLVMAGAYDGQRAAIEALAKRLGIHDRIRFPGWLADDAKRAALAGASFVVIPSRRDAMTLVVLEAGAYARPVLITSGCGFPDVAADGGGLMVEPTVEGLTGGLTAMAHARDRWDDMGAHMKKVTERYSWPAMAERYVGLFRGVLEERHT